MNHQRIAPLLGVVLAAALFFSALLDTGTIKASGCLHRRSVVTAPASEVVKSAPRPEVTPALNKKEKLDSRAILSLMEQIAEFGATDYPVSELRERFAKMRQLHREHNVIFMVRSDEATFEDGSIGPMAARRVGDQHYIIFYGPSIEFVRDFYADHPDVFIDEMLAAMWHETYHLVEQRIDSTINPTPEMRLRIESEAWWATMDQIIVPMNKAGQMRLPFESLLGSTQAAVIAHHRSEGNPHASAWQDFAKRVSQTR